MLKESRVKENVNTSRESLEVMLPPPTASHGYWGKPETPAKGVFCPEHFREQESGQKLYQHVV
ncbi:hypothetical protein EBO34_18685 [Alteribacter keqinensis]|uniref:Uncharacterized protein n=1 Tax=Alteribacter keqinensis TaxID=2483800 RepID=A0A3M7TKS5_9BACI|nr:hypothetical protein EBO34_18685 [Alteribacter keqinensis]